MFVRLLVLVGLLGTGVRALKCLGCKDCTGKELEVRVCINDVEFACGMTVHRPSSQGQQNASYKGWHVRRGCVPVARCSDDTDAGNGTSLTMCCSNDKCNNWGLKKEVDCAEQLAKNQTKTTTPATTTTALTTTECPPQAETAEARHEVRLFTQANFILAILAWLFGFLIAVLCGACRVFVGDKDRKDT